MEKNKIKKMSLEEKARLVVGYKTMSTFMIDRLSVRSLILSDGPNGVRKENENGDSLSQVSSSLEATCFPTGVSLAQTFNKDLAYIEGETIAKECNHYGINVLLGPAINIKRNPLCGRNFEYLSEDPILSGYMAASFIKGVESKNVSACPKHFACNNNENYRFTGDSILSERALREIYLKSFEIAIKEGKPNSIMTSYNKVNGYNSSENEHLNNILRKEWGFDGISMTDWGGIVNRVSGLKYGTDLEMPGCNSHNVDEIIKAVNNKTLDEEILNKSVERILNVIDKTTVVKKPTDFNKNYELALKVALEGAVLLKNDGNILPLNGNTKYVVLGDLFRIPRYQGSGSSLLNPSRFKSHIDAFNENKVNYKFYRGYSESDSKVDSKLLKEAISSINKEDNIIMFMGQNDYQESEGYDRETFKLPECELKLFDEVYSINKNIIVVLFGGSSVDLSSLKKAKAILYMGLSGEAVGDATYKLLFGEVSPSGRLTEEWKNNYEDTLFYNEFTKSPNELYKEDIFVGYRYSDSINSNVSYPFGYGLSYFNVKYENLKLEDNEKYIDAYITLKNESNIDANEVVEVFVESINSKVYRPLRELKAFTKVQLKPFERKEVVVRISKDDLKVWNDNCFKLEDLDYYVEVCKSSRDVILKERIHLLGELLKEDNELLINYCHNLSNLKLMTDEDFSNILGIKIEKYEFSKRPYTFETPIEEFKTPVGFIFKKAMTGVGLSQYNKAKRIKDERIREREKKTGIFISKLLTKNSLRSLSFSSSGSFDYKIAQMLLCFVNNKFIKGLKIIMKKENK